MNCLIIFKNRKTFVSLQVMTDFFVILHSQKERILIQIYYYAYA